MLIELVLSRVAIGVFIARRVRARESQSLMDRFSMALEVRSFAEGFVMGASLGSTDQWRARGLGPSQGFVSAKKKKALPRLPHIGQSGWLLGMQLSNLRALF